MIYLLYSSLNLSQSGNSVGCSVIFVGFSLFPIFKCCPLDGVMKTVSTYTSGLAIACGTGTSYCIHDLTGSRIPFVHPFVCPTSPGLCCPCHTEVGLICS